MGVMLLYLGVVAAIAGWWLSRQRLMAKPWLEAGAAGELPGTGASSLPAAKLGLGMFIAVASALLVLLISSYLMRMDMEDWRPLPQPKLLWLNTGVLVLSSLAMHHAQRAARRGDRQGAREGLLAGGMTAIVFLIGQVVAWLLLAHVGYRPATNPADAFFYLITAAHGLHVLGGLAALGRAGAKLRRGDAMDKVRLSLGLCATYWHFLLAAWIVLFGLLAYSPSIARLYAICSAPFR